MISLTNNEKKRIGLIKILDGMKMICKAEHRHPNKLEKIKARLILKEINDLDREISLEKNIKTEFIIKDSESSTDVKRFDSFGEFLQAVATAAKKHKKDNRLISMVHGT